MSAQLSRNMKLVDQLYDAIEVVEKADEALAIWRKHWERFGNVSSGTPFMAYMSIFHGSMSRLRDAVDLYYSRCEDRETQVKERAK